MSSGSLFNAEQSSSPNRKLFLIAIIALIAVSASVYVLYQFSKPKQKTVAEKTAEEIRDSTVMMLAQPTFSGADFSRQILGKGMLQRYAWKQKEAYFSFPQADAQEFDDFLNKFFVDRAKVEIGAEKNGKIKLGDYILTVSPENFYFFKTPLENIKIEPTQTLKFPFKTVDYSLSLEEMRNFTNNSQIYGGRMIAEMSRTTNESPIAFANHGIMVAKPNEPSLQRLTNGLLKETEDNREKKIQRLVDFVSNEIEYSYTEAVGGGETLKRADEVLMTRAADCSNKTILLASLLEQIGEEYILLYCPQHITVAVPQGNFPNENKLDFTWNGKPWMIAETTLPDFQIGKTRVQNFNKLTKIQYVQNPKETNVIFDANSYALLKFY
ncbi:MAG TPA: hypothetical protein VF721_16735 [Pyrinomonadaceae bacterium]|jgi:hypothetical protein